VDELLLVSPEPPPALPAPLAPALEPDDPPAPPPCAHVAVERPSIAAVIAAVSTFIFTIWKPL
jgi:hypothetical protein